MLKSMVVTAHRPDTSLLLEREAESAVVADAVEGVIRTGTGRLVVVEAAAGLGKTRLLAHARSIAVTAGLRAVTARARERDRESDFGLARQLLGPVLAKAGGAERERLTDGPANRAARLLESARGAEQSGDFAALHGLYWFCANLCAAGPVVMVVDDLQWSDAASLRFLAFLLPRLDGLPLVLVAGVRPGEPKAHRRLIDLMVTDPAAVVLAPEPLSETASAVVVRARNGRRAAAGFCAASWRLTGGNPLLLNELLAAAKAWGISPTADGARRLQGVGGDAIARQVNDRLRSLSRPAKALARAVAVLDGDARLREAAVVAGLEPATAGEGLGLLVGAAILAPGEPLVFVHPLVRTAVYRGTAEGTRTALHRRAANVLTAAGASAQRIAPHLLQLPPGGGHEPVRLLRRAAVHAADHGAPETALTYLGRCLAEPVGQEERTDLLVQLGALATVVDMKAAARHLEEAHRRTPDRTARARIACMLGAVLDYVHRLDDALEVLARAEAELPDSEVDLKRRLQAYYLNVLNVEPGKQHLVEEHRGWWDVDLGRSVGERLLECSAAFVEAKACVPGAVDRARRGLADGVLVERAPGEAPEVGAWLVLLTADRDEAVPLLDGAVARGRRRGAVRDLAPAYAFRCLGRLWRGALAEAVSDGRAACRAIDGAGVDLGRAWTAPYLASALVEQGDLAGAEAALRWAGVPDPVPGHGTSWLVLEVRARLLRLADRTEEALGTALLGGEYATSAGVVNPAFSGWRSEAALCLHRLGRTAEGRELAREELRLARIWGAPRALGNALRTVGLLSPGAVGLELLDEAAAVHEASPARLEHARTLCAFGGALRRAGRREEARPHLYRALELAHRCGADPLAVLVRTELRAAGFRPRRTELSGPESLTPSEARIAGLAASGKTNTHIARLLFVAPKTVEAHLSSVYRKLGITARTQLPGAMRADSAAS